MKLLYTLLPILTWSQITSAQADLLSAVARLPQCAQTCLTTALATSPCALTDQKCLCTNAQFLGQTEACVKRTCTLRQALTTKNATTTLCHAPIRDESNKIRITNIVVAAVSAACALSRLAFKIFTVGIGELGLDDYAVLAATIVGVPTVVIIDRGIVPNGLAQDVWTVPFDHIYDFGFWLYVLEIIYFVLIAMVKLTLLFFFLRIFPKPIVRKLIWATIIIDILYGLSFSLIAAFQCQPISHYWTRWDLEGEGKCWSINGIGWSNAIVSIVLDIWMLILPLYEIFHLQLSWRNKVGVALMFLVGTFVTVVSMLRLSSLINFGSSENPTWDQADVIHWSNIEINVGIICACMPSLRVILVRMFPKIFGSTKDATPAYGKYGSRSHGFAGGSVVRSGMGKSQNSSKDPHTITYTKTYTVHHGESDETSLVQMDNLEHKSGKPRSSNTSEVSF